MIHFSLTVMIVPGLMKTIPNEHVGEVANCFDFLGIVSALCRILVCGFVYNLRNYFVSNGI